MRDPLILIYETLKRAIREVHGGDFLVFDEFPMADRFRKEKRNGANISFVAASSEKGLMREAIPHKERIGEDGTTVIVATESLRMAYDMQVSFFAAKKGIAQQLSTGFLAYVEEKNELPLEGDPWGESMDIFLLYPPAPPEGEADLWQVDQTWRCRGKLLTEEVVGVVGQLDIRGKIENVDVL